MQYQQLQVVKAQDAAHFAQHFPQTDMLRTDVDGLPSLIQQFAQLQFWWVAKLFNGNIVAIKDEDLFAGDPNHPTSQGRPLGMNPEELKMLAFGKFQKQLKHYVTYGGRI